MYFHKRRNWLFADTVKGAKASAALYSIVSTARANGLEPYAYLLRSHSQIRRALPYCRSMRAQVPDLSARAVAVGLRIEAESARSG